MIAYRHPVTNTHEIVIDFNGNRYLVIYGKHINGGFFAIPNWNVGGELSDWLDDVFWNTESINRSLKDWEASEIISRCIAEDYKKYC